MHLYLLTRGIKHDVDRWVNEMSAQYMHWVKTHNGQKAPFNLQLSMRPIQLWEIVVPQNYMQVLLNTCQPESPDKWQFKPVMAALRKTLGAEKIPEWDKNGQKFPVFSKTNVATYAVGIKEDEFDKDGDEVI